jgi:Zn-dependent M28 family amino/carboxypeptidase
MRRSRIATAALTAAVVLGGASQAHAATTPDSQTLQDAVTVGGDDAGIKQHLKQLQTIATANGGTRSTGSPGHEASAQYVENKLKATGYYDVTSQPFVADVYTQLAPPTLSANPAPSPAWAEGQDYSSMEFSGSGAFANAPIAVIDYAAPTTKASTSTSGCEDADFPASLAGKVAVIQRGTCDFGVKAAKAQERGAAGVIIYNEGTIGDPDRNGLISGTLGTGTTFTIPVLDATYAAGKYLVDHPGATVSGSNTGKTEKLPTRNVIATTKTGRTDRQVVVGSHLDSVPEGPGINDDGSGSATDLETALQMARLGVKPRNQVRFIWFSGEEQGLLGSQYYVDQLSKVQRQNTAAMLDFDMLASPNWAIDIYDGDGSEFDVKGPNGSGTIESLFQKWFDDHRFYSERIAFDGRSDYDGFTAAGIPAGGITTGAEVHKDKYEQSQWGGTVSDSLAGQYDPCYHLACDSYPSNINDTALGFMSDAVANSIWALAQTTSAVNGTNNGTTKPGDWKGDSLVR